MQDKIEMRLNDAQKDGVAQSEKSSHQQKNREDIQQDGSILG
jgi:hypothetical protein